jgi:aminoglycoside 2'-N-acetyltransferase I
VAGEESVTLPDGRRDLQRSARAYRTVAAREGCAKLRAVQRVQTSPTDELDATTRAALRAMLDVAFDGEFDDVDWDHALGGVHAYVLDNGAVLAHASVVPRKLCVGETTLAAGYVEAVGTAPERRHRGFGSMVMRALADVIEQTFQLGALSTGVYDFYAQLGWERWHGPTFVQRGENRIRTEEDDDGLMVLRTSSTRAIDVRAAITCEWRAGDVW